MQVKRVNKELSVSLGHYMFTLHEGDVIVGYVDDNYNFIIKSLHYKFNGEDCILYINDRKSGLIRIGNEVGLTSWSKLDIDHITDITTQWKRDNLLESILD